MNKSIRFIVILSLLLCMLALMGCPPQAIDIPVMKLTSSPLIIPTISVIVTPSVSTSSSVIPVASSTLTPIPTQTVSSTTIPTMSPSVTATPFLGITPTPSSTPFATSTPTNSNEGSCGGGGAAAAGGAVIIGISSCCGCEGNPNNFLSRPFVSKISDADITTEQLFVSFTITGENFYIGKTTVDSVFYTSPETPTSAYNTPNDTKTVERNQSQTIIVEATETFSDIGIATAHLINSTTLKVKIPKSLFTTGFDFSSIKYGTIIRNPSYSSYNSYYGGQNTRVPSIDSVSSVDTTDPLFISYKITGTNLIVDTIAINSIFYTSPETLDSAKSSISDKKTVEKNHSQNIIVKATEEFIDKGITTAHLINGTTAKIKIPRSLFTSGFDFSNIKINSTLNYKAPYTNTYSSYPTVNLISVSLPFVDANFVMYTITGDNFFVGATSISSIFYTPPATFAMAEVSTDTITIEKLQSQDITVQATESLDINAVSATAYLVNANTIRIKIPRALFTPGFDFTQTRVGASLFNPGTAKAGTIGGGGLIN